MTLDRYADPRTTPLRAASEADDALLRSTLSGRVDYMELLAFLWADDPARWRVGPEAERERARRGEIERALARVEHELHELARDGGGGGARDARRDATPRADRKKGAEAHAEEAGDVRARRLALEDERARLRAAAEWGAASQRRRLIGLREAARLQLVEVRSHGRLAPSWRAMTAAEPPGGAPSLALPE